jgi:hypothetical protein
MKLVGQQTNGLRRPAVNCSLFLVLFLSTSECLCLTYILICFSCVSRSSRNSSLLADPFFATYVKVTISSNRSTTVFF